MVVEPGETYPMHRHRHPYLSVVIEGAILVLTDPTGRKERLRVRRGEVVWRVPPDAHSVENVGRTRFRNRLIELMG
jgi:quercetin dioxygenase-like cupin family protein